jgi:CheY-like chemotaxis protein
MDKLASSRPLEILLVEDSADDIRITRECFRRDKIHNTLRIADDGEIAMLMLRREGEYADLPLPDIVFLDLNMPNKNGYEVLTEIKTDPRLKHIPVVVLTGSKAETDVVKTYDMQADNYITKPVNMEKFIDVISLIDNILISAVVKL